MTINLIVRQVEFGAWGNPHACWEWCVEAWDVNYRTVERRSGPALTEAQARLLGERAKKAMEAGL